MDGSPDVKGAHAGLLTVHAPTVRILRTRTPGGEPVSVPQNGRRTLSRAFARVLPAGEGVLPPGRLRGEHTRPERVNDANSGEPPHRAQRPCIPTCFRRWSDSPDGAPGRETDHPD